MLGCLLKNVEAMLLLFAVIGGSREVDQKVDGLGDGLNS